MNNKKYLVWQNYMWGANYINQSGQFIPDYDCGACPPCVNYDFLRVLLERYNNLHFCEYNEKGGNDDK